MDNRQILSEIVVQISGFLVVFFILKKFAWKNLLGAIDARRHKIESEFAGIEKQKAQLAAIERDYRDRIDHIEVEARQKIQEAAREGQALAKEIQDHARADAQTMVERAKAEIEHDLIQARLSIRNQIVEVSGLVAAKVIQASLDKAKHEKLVDDALRDLERMN